MVSVNCQGGGPGLEVPGGGAILGEGGEGVEYVVGHCT